MELFNIQANMVDTYLNTIEDDRISSLIHQAKQQIDEIKTDSDLFEEYLTLTNLNKDIDPLVLWILFLSNEDICLEYNRKFKKGFDDFIPLNDLTDLTIYLVQHYQNNPSSINDIEILKNLETTESKEIDHNGITNLLILVQEQKKSEGLPEF